jgi:hypothetical protein
MAAISCAPPAGSGEIQRAETIAELVASVRAGARIGSCGAGSASCARLQRWVSVTGIGMGKGGQRRC